MMKTKVMVRSRGLAAAMMVMFLLACGGRGTGLAQTYRQTPLGLTATVGGVDVDVRFYRPGVVRVIKTPAGKRLLGKSLSVIQMPESVACTLEPSGSGIIAHTAQLQVAVNLRTGSVAFATANGASLLREKESSAVFTPFNDAGDSTLSVSQGFALEADEAIYGLGQQQQGRMIQRNLRLTMVQGNTDDYVPFFQSIKGYGLFWDNPSPTVFLDSSTGTSFSSEVGEGVDYYFLQGRNADGVIALMRGLTGEVPMFPLWTYGFWQSKERYKSQWETAEVVRKYRAAGVPLDGIIQDWQYWGDNFHWNAMEFLNPQFPDPAKMIADIHAMHAHLIISVWASFGPQTKQYEVMKAKNMLFDFGTWPLSSVDVWPPDMTRPSGVRVYDVYNPEARDIFWKFLNKGLFALGMDGWWLDSSEPDHMNAQPGDFNTRTFLGSFRKVRNAFPLMHVGGIAAHQRAASSAKRVFILTRSTYAGQQRYGANTWSGDVVASWGALRNQISAGLNLSLCGIPYWNSDIGGFFLWNFPKGLSDPTYRELYVRWIQFGAFCPMMRSHGTDAPREIYQFGAKGDKVYDAIAGAISLRYALLPYLYATSWDVTAHQGSMMRALMMDFPGDRTAIALNHEYLFGRSFLVAPVTEAQYVDSAITPHDTVVTANFQRTRSTAVYLPAGTAWWDFWTGIRHDGGQTVQAPTPLHILPLFVRAGSIVPFGPAVQYATERRWDTLEVRVYAGADGRFTLYEDENDSYRYEEGAYSTIPFVWDNARQTLSIGDRQGGFPGMAKQRLFRIVRVRKGTGCGMDPVSSHDAEVRYSGKNVTVHF